MTGYAWQGQRAVNPCACGCGEEVSIARRSDSRTGQVKGRPLRYVAGHNPPGKSFDRPGCPAPDDETATAGEECP